MRSKYDYFKESQELILPEVASLAKDAYGVSIMKYINDATGRNVNINAVHHGLKRLL